MTDEIPEEPQAPRAQCPLQTCDWSTPYPPSGDTADPDFRAVLDQHTESHDRREFLHTIGILQGWLFERDDQIRDLESALRGAHLIMRNAGIVPKTPFEAAGEQDIVTPPSGLLLPDHIAREQDGGHVVGKAKHGEVVPGKGKLVGKKITDPMVVRDLERRRKERGE